MPPTGARTRRVQGSKGPSAGQILEMQGEMKRRKAEEGGEQSAASSAADGQQQAADRSPSGDLSFKDIFFFCCFAYLAYRWFMGDSHVFSCDPTQPLVTFTDDFLPQEVFDGVKADIQGHPWLGPEPPESYNFTHTDGFSITLKEEGLEQFGSMPELQAALTFFRSARAPEANAWVLSVLSLKSGRHAPDDLAIAAHLDDAPGFIPMLRPVLALFNRKFASYLTSVLYISVPDDMEGGELELFEWDSGSGLAEAKKEGGVPTETIKPGENRLVVFRGDTVHRLRGPTSAGKGDRVSLVLEQYKLQDLMLNLTAPFSIRARQ